MAEPPRSKPPPPKGPPPAKHKTVSSRLPVPDGTTHLVTKASCAYAPGNLSSDGQRFVYAARASPVVVSYSNDSLAKGGGITAKAAFSRESPLVLATLCRTPCGHVLAAAREDGSIEFFDPSGARLLDRVDSSRGERVTAVSSDGRGQVFAGRAGGGLDVMAVSEGGARHDRVLACADGAVSAVAAAPEGPLVAVGRSDGALLLVDAAAGTVAARLDTSRYPVTTAVWCGGLVVAGNSVGRLYVADPAKGRLVAEISAHTRPVNALAAHPSRPLVASVSEDTWVHVWDLSDGASNVKVAASRSVDSSVLTGVTFCGRRGEFLAMTAYDSGTVRLVRFDSS